MSDTAEFIRHVYAITSHGERYTRRILNSKVWCAVESPLFFGCLFLETTDRVMPEDTVRHQGTHQECVEYIVSQFVKEV